MSDLADEYARMYRRHMDELNQIQQDHWRRLREIEDRFDKVQRRILVFLGAVYGSLAAVLLWWYFRQ